MPRGGYKPGTYGKPTKTAQAETSAPSRVPGLSFIATKPVRTNTDWKAGIRTPTFLSRNTSEAKLAVSVPDQPAPVQQSPRTQDEITESESRKPDLHSRSAPLQTFSQTDANSDVMPSSLSNELECIVQSTSSRTSSAMASGDDPGDAGLDDIKALTIEEAQSSTSSVYSRDSSSIYSRDSASIYSSASSIYSSNASIYSFDEAEEIPSSNLPGRPPYQRRSRTAPVRRQEIQDAAAREASSLAKKAALFKNSRLRPQLPSFRTSLPTWSMICRAVQASLDCYDSQAPVRRGNYTPANSSKDIKAMIIDDQLIDDSRLVIVSIRGTECKSLTDWAVNKAAKPVEPVGFLDDKENACHAGFLQVAKAMVGQIAVQLQQHPASSERPSLLFTGHSAGGAVAAMFYSHMLSTSVNSDLTTLASQFSSINCMTFGAPPISQRPRLKRDHMPGVFLAFANEGDPVLRLSDAASLKSLAKLMTASAPSSLAPPKVKVVRRSRGTSVIREEAVSTGPVTPWEELPLWPTPAPLLTNAGDVILLRDKENGSAAASRVTSEDLREVIFGDLAQHTTDMYIRRVKELALAAMMGC